MAARQPDQINQLPEPPNPADRSTFNSRAYPWSEALKPWTDEVNAVGSDTFYNAQLAEQSAGNAGGAAQAAEDAADRAEQAETNAAQSATAAGDSADGAASSATTAEAAKTDAVTAKNAAESYAGEARQSADEAASVILGQVFDDTTESSSFGWTSSKIASWFNGLTTAFTRTILGRSTAQEVRDDLQLTYPATAPTVGDGADVMRTGAYGLGGFSVHLTDQQLNSATVAQFFSLAESTIAPYVSGITLSYADASYATQIFCGQGIATPNITARNKSGGVWHAPVTLYHSGNTLNIGTTASTARAALNLFADASGVITNGPGQLSNDMSNFLSSMTFDDMNEKLGGNNQPLPTKDHGDVAVAGSQTVACNVQESDFHIMSMAESNTTGTLTIDFSNMPDTLGKHFSWHVRLQRGARKTVAFAQTINWAGGVAPTFGSALQSQDLMMFYKVGSETIRGMVIDAW